MELTEQMSTGYAYVARGCNNEPGYVFSGKFVLSSVYDATVNTTRKVL